MPKRKNTGIRKTIPALVLGICFAAWCGVSAEAQVPPSGGEDFRLARILERLASYRPQGSDPILVSLQDYIHRVRRNPAALSACEEALVAFLDQDITSAARMEVCRQLRRIGTERSVPVLSRLLRDEDAADAARYALEAVPGKAAERALLNALAESNGKTRLGIISSLGARGSRAAASGLSELLDGSDAEAAAAAVDALGRIESAPARAALLRVLEQGPENLRVSCAGALLHSAERARAAGDREGAFKIYQTVFEKAPSGSLRVAAFRGRVTAAGASARDLLFHALQGEDRALRAAAIPLMGKFLSPADLPTLAPAAQAYSVSNRISWLQALCGFEGDEARTAAADFLKSPETEVRIAALQALGKLGGGEDVESLVRHIVTSRAEEQAAARAALYRLKTRSGAGIDQAVLDLLERGPDSAEAVELIRAVGIRLVTAGRPLLFQCLESSEAVIRLEAARALQLLVEDRHGPRLLKLLIGEREDSIRMALVNAAAAAARRHTRPENSAAAVVACLEENHDSRARAILFRVLGRIGDDSALPLVLGELHAEDAVIQDAAIRTLADWPTPAARGAQFATARDTGSLTVHVLCLRAFLNSVSGESYPSAEAGARPLIEALGIARRAEEKITVLGLLPKFPCAESLAAAESQMADPSVGPEARKAAASIKSRIE